MYPLRGTKLVTEIWRLTSWILLSVSRLKSTSIRFHRKCFPLMLENLQLSGFVVNFFPFVLENLQKVAPSDLRVPSTGLRAVYFYAHSKHKRPSSKWSFNSQLNANGPVMNVHNNKWIPIRSPEWSMCLPVNRTDSIGLCSGSQSCSNLFIFQMQMSLISNITDLLPGTSVVLVFLVVLLLSTWLLLSRRNLPPGPWGHPLFGHILDMQRSTDYYRTLLEYR